MTTQPTKKTCFVIMPFSDMDGYEPGHFGRVYEHLIRPACVAAGFEPIRGDEVKGTNYIAIDILQRILKSDMVVCDLSGRNANVMYELGVRQAFDLPVALLKDKKTDRIFDIQGLRTLDYTESLRVDSVARDIQALSQTISATGQLESHEINSLVRLLGVKKATLGTPTEVSQDTALLLASLKDISTRLSAVEETTSQPLGSAATKSRTRLRREPAGHIMISGGGSLTIGSAVFDMSSGKAVKLGTLMDFDSSGLLIESEKGTIFLLPPEDPRFKRVSEVPF
jgi:hypothetical protein